MLQRNSGNDRTGMESGAEFDTEWEAEFEELYGQDGVLSWELGRREFVFLEI